MIVQIKNTIIKDTFNETATFLLVIHGINFCNIASVVFHDLTILFKPSALKPFLIGRHALLLLKLMTRNRRGGDEGVADFPRHRTRIPAQTD